MKHYINSLRPVFYTADYHCGYDDKHRNNILGTGSSWAKTR